MSRTAVTLILTVPLLALIVPLFLSPELYGDDIWYKDGRRIEGKIIAEEADRVQIRVRMGTIWVPRKQIHRIKKGPLASEEFEQRLAELDPADLPGHERLIQWARDKDLESEAKRLEERIPEVTRRHRIAKNPRRWCRDCESHGHRDCAECTGKGVQTQKCVRCSGKKLIRCRVCGRRHRDGQLKCAQCSGAGEVEKFDPKKGAKKKVKCDACKGMGIHKCPACKGKGEQECPGCLGKGGIEKPCARCSGDPREPCPTCKGTGLQENALTDEQLAAEAEARKKAEQEPAPPEKDQAPTPEETTSKPKE